VFGTLPACPDKQWPVEWGVGSARLRLLAWSLKSQARPDPSIPAVSLTEHGAAASPHHCCNPPKLSCPGGSSSVLRGSTLHSVLCKMHSLNLLPAANPKSPPHGPKFRHLVFGEGCRRLCLTVLLLAPQLHSTGEGGRAPALGQKGGKMGCWQEAGAEPGVQRGHSQHRSAPAREGTTESPSW